MGRNDPESLWQQHLLERYKAFRLSGDFRRLKKRGLAACRRKKRYTGVEWAKSSMRERYSSPEYMEFHRECETVGKRFGLASWTVESACLISRYKPEQSGLVMESRWPTISLVTESEDSLLLARLAYEAQLRGIRVIARHNSVETPYLLVNPVPLIMLEAPPLPAVMPDRNSVFRMRVEIPVGYPPEAARNRQKIASGIEKEILSALGYPVSKRLRVSKLVHNAKNLKVNKDRLPKRGLYEIVAKTEAKGTIEEDRQKVKTIKTQRYRARKRYVEPYKEPGNST